MVEEAYKKDEQANKKKANINKINPNFNSYRIRSTFSLEGTRLKRFLDKRFMVAIVNTKIW